MYLFSHSNNADYNIRSILQVLVRINPYTPIPFILLTFLLILYIIHSIFLTKRQLTTARHLEILQFRLFRFEFILSILILELTINVLAFLSWSITNTYKNDLIPHRRLANNCWIHGDKSLLSLHSHTDENLYWVYFLPRILDVTSLMLMPTITLFVRILREYYLERSYDRMICRHIYLLLIRFIIMIFLINVFRTYMIYQFLQAFLFLYDFVYYLLNRQRLYYVLRGIRNQARIDPIRMKLIEKENVLSHYQLPSIFTGLILFVIVLEIIVSTFFSIFKMLLVNGCYFHYISWGIIPTLTVGRSTVEIVYRIGDYVIIITFIIGIIHQALMSLAYFLVLLIIAYNCWIKWRYYKNLHLSTKPLMDAYRSSYYTQFK